MKPIYTTRGERKNPLHLYYWSDGSARNSSQINERDINKRVENLFDLNLEKPTSSASNADGQEMREFRTSLSGQVKRDVSEIQGELFGHLYVTEHLRYQEVFHADSKSKSMRQGLDSVYYDPKAKELVVVEFKGQNSPESKGQKETSWTIKTCEKIQQRQGNYRQASESERNAANQILEAYNKGERIRYEVVRTEVNEKNGKFKTQLEKQTRLEKKLAEKQDKKAVVDKLYNKSKERPRGGKPESKSESKVESKSKSKKG
jgi:hypothetical protein